MDVQQQILKPTRLQEIGERETISPFVRATKLESASLYWLGVGSWPPRFRDRQWILAFTDRLLAHAEATWEMVPLQFLSMVVAGNLLNDLFIRNAREIVPILGATSRPGRTPVGMPTPEQIDQAKKKQITLEPDRYAEDFVYWFVRGEHQKQRSLFQAFGGMTILLAAPDTEADIKVPQMPGYVADHPSMARFKAIDMKAEARVVENLGGKFGVQSKEFFGAAYKELAIWDGLAYVLPRWTSASFFDAKPEELENLFKLCKVYIQESPEDKGILIASQDNLDEVIIQIVEDLKKEKMEYGL